MGNKTFYITPDNEEHLKNETNKSGLINRLLEEHYIGPLNSTIKKVHNLTTPEKIEPVATQREDKNIKVNEDGTISPREPMKPSFLETTPPRHKDKDTPFRTDDEWIEAVSAEHACCKKKTPCKHWQFINGMWINSLSGRSKEVEE